MRRGGFQLRGWPGQFEAPQRVAHVCMCMDEYCIYINNTPIRYNPPNVIRSVAQEAREAREARARARLHEAAIATAVRAARRWLGRTKARRELEEDLDRKLRDVAALRQVVEKSKGLPFCPPVPASARLVRQFLFCCHRRGRRGPGMYSPADVSDREATRVGRLCACVLLPHLRQARNSDCCEVDIALR